MDKATMTRSIKKELWAYLSGGDITEDIAEWVWDDLAEQVPDFDEAISEQSEEAAKLFDACFAEVLKELELILKE